MNALTLVKAVCILLYTNKVLVGAVRLLRCSAVCVHRVQSDLVPFVFHLSSL